ncbi:MAG: hypothetical protein M0P01_08030 [Treponema sp.]|nr:hypothetical protein [Treponema sp.]
MKRILFIIMVLPLINAIAQTDGSKTIDYQSILNKNNTIGVVKRFSPADYSGVYDSNKPFPVYNEALNEMYQVDVISADLRNYDLRNRYNDLIHSSFDTRTKWPKSLPDNFKPDLIMDMGKDPGLNIRELHKRKITGKKIGIAILDSWLFTEHDEYKKQLKCYEEIHALEEPTMHGTSVSSLAVGKTVGVAPDAELYYIAVTAGYFNNQSFDYDYLFLAQAIERICEINKNITNKIRVLTITLRIKPERKNYDLVMQAIKKAERENIFVIYVGCKDYKGLYRNPLSNPNDFNSYKPGLYWQDRFYTGKQDDNETQSLLIPSDSRCTASPAGTSDYTFDSEGGLSWAVPYIAGIYALACQVYPSVTPDIFWKAALETGKTITIYKDSKEFSLGKIINPEGIIEVLK